MNIKKYFILIINSIKRRGLINTIQFLRYELIFESKYKIDTIGIKEIDKLTIKGKNKKHGKDYQGFSYFYFKKFMSKLDIEFEDSVFIDLGCGKGRALIIAAEFNFKKITGVEFAKELYDICRDNLNKVKDKLRTKNIEIYYDDAINYDIPDDANVLFFNNPFDEKVMEMVLNNIEDSLQNSNRIVYIIYLSPLYENCFYKMGYQKSFELKNKNKVEGIIYMKQ